MGKYLLFWYIWLLIVAISFENNMIIGVIIILITTSVVIWRLFKGGWLRTMSRNRVTKRKP